jgi:hypothetical protein
VPAKPTRHPPLLYTRKKLALDEISFLGNAFERLAGRLDTVEQVAAFRWKQAHDLVLPGRGRHARAPGIVIDNLPDFEFVPARPATLGTQRLFFPPSLLIVPTPNGRANGKVEGMAGLGLSAFGLRFSLLFRCSRFAITSPHTQPSPPLRQELGEQLVGDILCCAQS